MFLAKTVQLSCSYSSAYELMRLHQMPSWLLLLRDYYVSIPSRSDTEENR